MQSLRNNKCWLRLRKTSLRMKKEKKSWAVESAATHPNHSMSPRVVELHCGYHGHDVLKMKECVQNKTDNTSASAAVM